MYLDYARSNMANKKRFGSGLGIIKIIVALIAILLFIVMGWMVYTNFAKKSSSLTPVQSNSSTKPQDNSDTTPSPSDTPDPYSGWLQYCSQQEKSCFKYPSTWTTKDVGSVDPNGDGISLTSPNGTLLWFQSAVSGLGGSCDPNTDPHVFIKKVIALPHVSNLYIVETEYGNTGDITHIGIVDSINNQSPQAGDVGSCIYYTTFKSRHDTSTNAWFEINGNSITYLKAVDIPTVELILESYTY